MSEIRVLDEQTIDKIAAGEVVERPSSVVKELVENAIDAKATAITIEIKDGGTSFIRITDNGQGIPKALVPAAFLRHATSKLASIEDLLTISSLGFRGEALSSIASVSQVELITKATSELTGTKYMIEGSKEKSCEDIGAPEGTTFLVRNLFFNTPARQKFLKTPQTEASYISTLVERLALSHPDISFQFIVNNQPKLHTNGNTRLKDIIYHIFGRDIAGGVLPVHVSQDLLSVEGFIGKPFISRGNRNFETYFINGRYIKSNLITKCIEDAYKPYLMKHQYPFTVLQITMDSRFIDVNVHPAKMEVRFQQSEAIYHVLTQTLQNTLKQQDLIPQVPPKEKKQEPEAKPRLSRGPEPFERKRMEAVAAALKKDSPYERKYTYRLQADGCQTQVQATQLIGQGMDRPERQTAQAIGYGDSKETGPAIQTRPGAGPDGTAQLPGCGSSEGMPVPLHQNGQEQEVQQSTGQMQDCRSPDVYGQLAFAESNSYHTNFIQEAKRRNYTIIGQLFDTYWLVQVENELFIIDQHAAHEKVLYEHMMKKLSDGSREFPAQQISPPVIITMTMLEQELFQKYQQQFLKLGFEVNAFGGREYAICAVPANLYNLDEKSLFIEMLDGLSQDTGKHTPETILEKVASMSCKAAVKGSQHLSRAEVEQLLADLLELENPYHCPHGRPTIISMSKTEIEKKFKRIV